MRSHLLVIKVFVVVGAVWLYVIHPTQVPSLQKLGPAPLVEQAARFTFPKIEPIDDSYEIVKVSGEHRELSLRDVSSVSKPVKKDDEEKSSEKAPAHHD